MARRTRGRRATAERLGLIDDRSRGRAGKRPPLPSDGAIVVRLFRRIVRILLRIAATFLIGSIALVLIYRFVDPPITPLMIIRPLEGAAGGTVVGVEKEWVDLDEIDPDLVASVIAAEDARFFTHGGVDWEAVEEARVYNEKNKGKKMRGASTITMQCARNVFLWQGRNYLRKGLEVYFTYLIELAWGKERILEVYLNAIEWGDGIYGAEAAAQANFATSARELSPRQAALMAAVLPNPRRWSPAKPTGYINQKVGRIMKGARVVSIEMRKGVGEEK